MEYMQNQMDNLIQSGINERENMITTIEKWQSTAKELAEALEKSIEQNDKWALHDEDYDNIDKYKTVLQNYKTLTDGKND